MWGFISAENVRQRETESGSLWPHAWSNSGTLSEQGPRPHAWSAMSTEGSECRQALGPPGGGRSPLPRQAAGGRGEHPHPRAALRCKAGGQREGATSGRKLGGASQDQGEGGGAGWNHSFPGQSSPTPPQQSPTLLVRSPPLCPVEEATSGEHLLGRGTVCGDGGEVSKIAQRKED